MRKGKFAESLPASGGGGVGQTDHAGATLAGQRGPQPGLKKPSQRRQICKGPSQNSDGHGNADDFQQYLKRNRRKLDIKLNKKYRD